MKPSTATMLLMASTMTASATATTFTSSQQCNATCDPTNYPPNNLALLDNFFSCEANSQEYVGYSTQLLPTSTNPSSWAQTEIKKFSYTGVDQSMDFSWVQTAGNQYCSSMSLATSAVAMNRTMQDYYKYVCSASPLPCLTQVTEVYLGLALVTPEQSTVCSPDNTLTEQIYTSAQMNVPTYDQGNVDVEPIIGAGILNTLPGFFDVTVPITVGQCNGACTPTCVQYNGTSCAWETNGITTSYTAGTCSVVCSLTRPGDLIYGGLITVVNGSPLKAASPQTVPSQPPTNNNGGGGLVVVIGEGSGSGSNTATPQTPLPCPSNAIAIEIPLIGSGITSALCGSQITAFEQQFLSDISELTGAPTSQFLILYSSFNDFDNTLYVQLAIYNASSSSSMSAHKLKTLAMKSFSTTTALDAQVIANGLYDNNAAAASGTTYGPNIDNASIKQMCDVGVYKGFYSSSCMPRSLIANPSGTTATNTQNVTPAWVWAVIAVLVAICFVGLMVSAFFYFQWRRSQKLLADEIAAMKNAQVHVEPTEDSQMGMRIPVGQQPNKADETQPFSPSSYVPTGWQSHVTSPQSTHTTGSDQVEGEMNKHSQETNSTLDHDDDGAVNITFAPLSTRSRGMTASSVRVKTAVSQ